MGTHIAVSYTHLDVYKRQGTVGLSLSTSLPGDAGLYVAPTPTQLLRDTLSAVQVGLYSSLG